MFNLKSIVMNYFHLEEHGDELLIVDVAVSVQVRLLYQLLGRDSSHTQRLSKQGWDYWSKWRCILIVEFSRKTEHGINRFWSKWYLPLPNVLFLLLSRQKKVYRQGSALHAPTLRPWDSIFNFMFYVCQPWVLIFNFNACANSATMRFNCQPYNLRIINNLILTLLENRELKLINPFKMYIFVSILL